MKIPQETSLFETARLLIAGDEKHVAIRIVEAKGSTPRNLGCEMLVTPNHIFGTIGGGQLEWIATKHARILIETNKQNDRQKIALGPEIGQCCGGSVTLSYERVFAENLHTVLSPAETSLPIVQIHGAGHTGKALVKVLELLPFELIIIDSRADSLPETVVGTNVIHSPLPEENVRKAAPNTAFVIFTHEHHLDFLIAAEALRRKDAAYVGMIGSKTKKAVFSNWLKDNDYDPGLMDHLTCPIGATTIKDKRPEVIAAMVAAELLQVFSQ